MDEFFEDKNLSIDNLTKVYNRDVIVCYIENLILKKVPFSMALIDIDNFKYINDTYGHILGDKVICETVNRIRTQIETCGGVLGRFGGDEFIIVLPKIVSYDEVWQTCHRILVNISEAEYRCISNLYVTVTIGLARFPENANNYEKLLETADKALYRGKMKGRNCFIIYLPEKHANIVLKTEKDKQLSSMHLHAIVFNHLTRPEKLRDGIRNLFDFISSYFMIDHLSLQDNGENGNDGNIYFEKIHQLSRNKKFSQVNLNILRDNINKTIEMFYLNDVKQLIQSNLVELYDSLCEQQITSACYVDIAYQGKTYGMLRAEMTGLPDSHRIWQHIDMDILLSTAKIIALILHYSGKNLSEI